MSDVAKRPRKRQQKRRKLVQQKKLESLKNVAAVKSRFCSARFPIVGNLSNESHSTLFRRGWKNSGVWRSVDAKRSLEEKKRLEL
jgi:hypothetical protein